MLKQLIRVIFFYIFIQIQKFTECDSNDEILLKSLDFIKTTFPDREILRAQNVSATEIIEKYPDIIKFDGKMVYLIKCE